AIAKSGPSVSLPCSTAEPLDAARRNRFPGIACRRESRWMHAAPELFASRGIQSPVAEIPNAAGTMKENMMGSHTTAKPGPDLAAGVPVASFGEGLLLQGHVAGETVLLARVGDEVLAVGGHCTHYSAPLAQGI